MTKVTLKGVEHNIKFGWKAAIDFQTETGETALEIKNFQDGNLNNLFHLVYAMLTSSNRDKSFPKYDDWLDELGNDEEVSTLINACVAEYMDYMLPKKGDIEEMEKKKKENPEKEGKEPKNQ